jgi:serine/threonine protein kinase
MLIFLYFIKHYTKSMYTIIIILMGNKANAPSAVKHRGGEEKTTHSYSVLSKSQFDFLYVIGKGGFGKVWKVVHKKYKKTYALKEMSKAKIIDRKSQMSVKYERDLLSKLRHPFIINMHYAFQDFENIYIVMDLLTGGDLRFHVSKYKRFTEEQTSKIY